MNLTRRTSYLLLTAILAWSSAAVGADTQDVDSPSTPDARFNAWLAPFLEELNLAEEQKPKFLAIQKAMTKKWAEFQKMPLHERKPKQEAFYRARFPELEQLLTEEQMA